jgi:hypothetical protein
MRTSGYRPELIPQRSKTCDIGPLCGLPRDWRKVANNNALEPAACVHTRERNPSFSASAGGAGVSRQPRPLSFAQRGSWSLNSAQMGNIDRAVSHALEIGLPLNRFVTINWEAAGIEDCTRATGRFLKQAGDWLRRLGRSLAYVWVQERGARIGQHVHILLHVPADLARRFSGLQRGWLKACGARFHKGLIKSRCVGRSYRAAGISMQGAYCENLERVVGYLLKEGPPSIGRKAAERQRRRSFVRGKRCSTSENIGALARSLAVAVRRDQSSRHCNFAY